MEGPTRLVVSTVNSSYRRRMSLLLVARWVVNADGTQLLSDHGVWVDGDTIVSVGPVSELRSSAARVLDLGEVTLLPGFVDAHTHVSVRPGEGDQHGQLARPPAWLALRAARNVEAMLASGVTTARIMGEPAAIDFAARALVASGDVMGPSLRVAGEALSATHGHGVALGVADGVEGVRLAVRRNLAAGADHVKFFMTGGVSSSSGRLFDHHYRREEVRAIVDEAHRVGRRVAVHAHGGPGVSICAEEGVDSIEHGSLLTEENVALMVKHGTSLVLTKSIAHHPEGIEKGDASAPAVLSKLMEARKADVASFERVRQAGLRFALGTDAMHGFFGEEIGWLVDHGVPAPEAFLAATWEGARVLGEEDTLGRLQAGFKADVVALAGNAFDAPREALEGVRWVMKGGRPYEVTGRRGEGRVLPSPDLV